MPRPLPGWFLPRLRPLGGVERQVPRRRSQVPQRRSGLGRGHGPAHPSLTHLYSSRGSTVSINFITCHDGFTLNDLVSYDGKHNEANGENNNDGGNDNHSWNCGWEGPSTDPAVNELRRRQIKNALAMLLASQGVPMILMGDEAGHTQQGNNNTYCHDTELNWFDWSLVEKNADLVRFCKNCIAFRKSHPVLRGERHLRNQDYVGSGYPDISWHGTRAWNPDWSGASRILAFMLCGRHARGGTVRDNDIYVALNMYWDGLELELPQLPPGKSWHVFANTGAKAPEDCWEPGREPPLANPRQMWIGGRSVAILLSR